MAATTVQSPSTADFSDDWITGLNHVALHVRSVDEATDFFIRVLGGKAYRPPWIKNRLFHVQMPGTIFAFFEGPGLVGWELEYPHYAFEVTSDGIRGMKRRLEAFGVKTHEIWTRNKIEALLYFRDPSGNLFELYCPKYDNPEELEFAAKYGGSFKPPIDKLHYEWKG